MRAFRSETIHLCYADNALKYYFSDPGTLYSFEDELTVYAIYRIRGYALTLTKEVVGDREGHRNIHSGFLRIPLRTEIII